MKCSVQASAVLSDSWFSSGAGRRRGLGKLEGQVDVGRGGHPHVRNGGRLHAALDPAHAEHKHEQGNQRSREAGSVADSDDIEENIWFRFRLPDFFPVRLTSECVTRRDGASVALLRSSARPLPCTSSAYNVQAGVSLGAAMLL